MDAERTSYTNWRCPFCGEFAAMKTQQRVVCESRSCVCGAIALAAPVVDTDENVDDALNTFRVSIREESRGYDSLLLDGLRHGGVEIREGRPPRVGEGYWREYISLWFRRACPLSLQS